MSSSGTSSKKCLGAIKSARIPGYAVGFFHSNSLQAKTFFLFFVIRFILVALSTMMSFLMFS